MSRETAQWLNTHTLQGFTDKRGTAWHYDPDHQIGDGNHFPGPIPVEAVRRLLDWTPRQGTVESTVITDDGVTRITDDTRQALIHPVTGVFLGVFKKGYKVHPYGPTLIDASTNILDGGGLGIGSAGELREGAVAWVQFEMDETVHTPEGIDFRPFLTAATSLDGSLASTFQTGSQVVVCDNTLSAALGDSSARRIKVKHSRHSLPKLTELRDGLGIVTAVADDFSAQIHDLCSDTVTDAQWQRFLDAHVPTPDEGKGRTLALAKRGELTDMWTSDPRVAPWRGTAFGVVQAVNTYAHHQAHVRGMSRPERNALRMVTGQHDALDRNTLDTLAGVR